MQNDNTTQSIDSLGNPRNPIAKLLAIGKLYLAATPTAVPEAFTIVGTLMGGATAFKMRKRFQANNKR